MKRCGRCVTVTTNVCADCRDYNRCVRDGFCEYQVEVDEATGSMPKFKIPPNCGSSAQKPPKPQIKERAEQDCSTCDHKTVCKYKEKFETIVKEHFPLLCVCQWYKKENDICTE